MNRAGRRPKGSLSLAEARRLALAAQGFGLPRPAGRIDGRHLAQALARLGLLQIDSVNVLVRAHYLPLFSRLGPYPRAVLERAAYDPRRRRLFEYWGHEASLLPLDLHPCLRWRMARAERGEGIYRSLNALARERPDQIAGVLAEVAARGPLGISDFAAERSGGGWWGWSEAKRALEWLFWTGRITTAGRRGFERLYDLTERVLPAAVLARPTPPEAEARRHLLGIAARALGIAGSGELGDYFRIGAADARAGIEELAEAGEILPVQVEGWRKPAWLHRDARLPRRIHAQALVSPFDSLIFERARTERLFGFRYRIGIYTPKDRREHGYYVLPFLLGDRLVARVDLKADRAGGRLLVQAAHAEPEVAPGAVAAPLAGELQAMAEWLDLRGVAVNGAGNLAGALRTALG